MKTRDQWTGLTRAETQQRVLIAERQRRTRKLLALVEPIALQTLQKEPPREVFCLATACPWSTSGNVWKGSHGPLDLGEIVRMEIVSPETVTASALAGLITDPRTTGLPWSRITGPNDAVVRRDMCVPPLPAQAASGGKT